MKMEHRMIDKGLSRSLLLWICCWMPVLALAQDDYPCDQPNKKARKYYEAAEKLRFKGDDAYINLRKSIEEDPEFGAAYSELAWWNYSKYKAGSGHLRVTKGSANFGNRALKYWDLALEYCPEYRNFENYYLMGKYYYDLKQYTNAEGLLEAYVTSANASESNSLKKAKQYLDVAKEYRAIMQNPVPFDPKLVAGISTENDEYLPMLSPDNRFLYVTRKQMVDTKSSVGKVEKELFIKGKNNYDGSFHSGVPMPKPFNQGDYQGGVSVSVDNKLMFITLLEEVIYSGFKYLMGNIYYSEFKEGRWTDLKSVGDHINRRLTWEGQPSISSDNKTLYFTRAIQEVIPGEHYGQMDIYKSERREDGSWGPAINLGPEINTAGNEKTPFMHSDSYTLYFSSDEHAGVGGFDIFYAKMKEDETFTKAKNLGYPINTESDEHGFVVSTDGKYGYFSSKMEGTGLDIYSFELYDEARPEHVVFVRGESLSGAESVKGLEIKLKNVATNKEVDAVIDEETGKYVGVIAVEEDEDVLMTAKKDGYAFTSQYISSNENVIGKPIELDMEVKPIEVGETYRINNITFATNSYEIRSHVHHILDEFAEFLKTNANVKVEIRGHTDNVGRQNDNMVLSENRAGAVRQYLMGKGIAADRLSHKGFGSTKPVATNDTKEGRALNRRTEFLILSK